MQTRKYPRTMQEAFGPHTSNQLATNERMHPKDKIVVWASALAGVALLVLVIGGYVK